MKDIEISPSMFMRDAEHRAFFGRVAAYAFFLFCLVPLATGILLPWSFSLTDEPFASMPTRLILLVATGGASAVLALLPAFLVLRSKLLRKAYVFLLFPIAMVSLATQSIMYREFGTEIDSRLLGLFQGNFGALWTFARTEYHLDWLLAGLAIASVAMPWWICREDRKRWTPSARSGLGIGLALVVTGSLALAIQPDISRADHYHPSKLSSAPLFQVLSFIGHHYIGGHSSGYRGILEEGGPVGENEFEELTRRLGAEPEEFSRRVVARPDWLKRHPSHVFLFFMESIEYDLIENPDLADVAPYIRKFAAEGLLTPNFSASSGATVDAIHATVAGAGAQSHYAVPRALTRFPLDTLPKLMKRSGYTPVFFAASRRHFGDKGDACEAYGYERFTGCPDAADHIKSNEWGVNDGDFFQWTLGELGELESPHFVSFLNVSNHTPFDAPLHELGDIRFSEATMKRFVGRNEEDKVHFAKHIRYADQKMGEMAETLRSQHPDALFVFVGDHTSSKLRCDALRQVPFVLWNDRVIDPEVDTSRWFGGHIDILATLANLVLPEGDDYTSLGQPVWNLANDRVTSAGQLAITNKGYMTKTGVKRDRFPTLNSGDSSDPKVSENENHQRASAINALSWGYLHDKELPHKPEAAQ